MLSANFLISIKIEQQRWWASLGNLTRPRCL